MRADHAAAASLSGSRQTLTRLGVRITEPVDRSRDDLLFAPEAAALYDRSQLVTVAGFASSLIETHEDADLGWRLALNGLRTIQGPEAVATVGSTHVARLDTARRLRHRTANELATLFVCAGEEWLRQALPAALARLISVACDRAGLDPRAFDFDGSLPASLSLPVESVAVLLAIEDFARRLPDLRERRYRVQSARVRPDAEIEPLLAPDAVDQEWLSVAGEGAHALCRALGLEKERASFSTTLFEKEAASFRSAATLSATPKVSIIILTRLGPTHLPACLDSLAALDYPRDAVEVIVVDNASKDDPTASVERHYPGARLLRQLHNLGFCGGNNVGTRAARHEWLFFLNDDTRVEPQLLRAFFATAARRETSCVGATVVDWDGQRIDFAGGGMNFEGRGFQHGMGSDDLARWRRERPLLFANGAAVLIHRDAYAAAGGFPEEYFAYYEDVALGWALWILGNSVWLCPDAIVRHRHHGTSSTAATAARVRNCERNALYTLLTHADDTSLSDVLSASLILAATRTLLGTGLGGFRRDVLAINGDRRLSWRQRLRPFVLRGHMKAELLRRGAGREHGIAGSIRRVGAAGLVGTIRSMSHLVRWGGPPRTEADIDPQPQYAIGLESAATLVGAAEWCRNAHRVESLRIALQENRRRSDHEVISQFQENWLDVIPIEPSRQAEYEQTHREVIGHFDLGRFARVPRVPGVPEVP